MDDCLFCKIIRSEIPAEKVYEDDAVIAFKDIYPKARVHILVVPKRHIPTAMDLQEEDDALLGKMARAVADIAKKSELEGYRLLMNVGKKGGQEIFHIHLHLLAD